MCFFHVLKWAWNQQPATGQMSISRITSEPQVVDEADEDLLRYFYMAMQMAQCMICLVEMVFFRANSVR